MPAAGGREDAKPTNLFALWSPRSTHIRTHKGEGGVHFLPNRGRFPFAPQTLGDYRVPRAPPSLKKPPPVRAAPPTADELSQAAADLRSEVSVLEKSGVRSAPPVNIQLGLLLLSKDDMIKKILKDWDTKGKGEFIKAEFRLNLRNTGINVTSAEADGLFDSWDDVRASEPARLLRDCYATATRLQCHLHPSLCCLSPGSANAFGRVSTPR